MNHVLILESNVSSLSAIDSPSVGFQWRNISIASLRLTRVPNPWSILTLTLPFLLWFIQEKCARFLEMRCKLQQMVLTPEYRNCLFLYVHTLSVFLAIGWDITFPDWKRKKEKLHKKFKVKVFPQNFLDYYCNNAKAPDIFPISEVTLSTAQLCSGIAFQGSVFLMLQRGCLLLFYLYYKPTI